jgi:hypothetical protein
MTNHEMFVSSMKNYTGKALTTSEIWEILSRDFPNFNKGSFLPNDHGNGNIGCCPCAGTESRVFDRVGRGNYIVR